MLNIKRKTTMLQILGVAVVVSACSVKPGRHGSVNNRKVSQNATVNNQNDSFLENTANYDSVKEYASGVCDEPKTLAGPRRLRLLSNAELRYTIKDLFNVEASSTVNLPNDISKHMLFDHIGAEHPLHLDQLREYLKVAESVAASINIATAAACSSDMQNDKDKVLTCFQDFLKKKGQYLWRRPLMKEERDGLELLFRTSFEASTIDAYASASRAVLTAMLFSPHFLYRSELGEPQADGRYLLTEWEIATALSYLAWRSVPDERLWQLAEDGTLIDPAVRKSEFQRMLKDEKAKRAVGDFANLWTRAYKVLTVPKDSTLFPNFDQNLRKSLRDEIINFYQQVFFNADPKAATFKAVMTANYTVGGEDLAQFYHSFTENNRISLANQARIGVIGKAGLLAGYSYATIPSPIHRGVFVLENLLCRIFPEPPAVTIPQPDANKSNRERFAGHSDNPNCSGCHVQIDQVGFSMESYNAIGQIIADNIDATNKSQLNIDGQMQTFNDAVGLSETLSASSEAHNCHTRQWYRFSFGQHEKLANEQCFLKHLGREFSEQGGQIQDLLVSLVSKDFYIYRMNQPPKGDGK